MRSTYFSTSKFNQTPFVSILVSQQQAVAWLQSNRYKDLLRGSMFSHRLSISLFHVLVQYSCYDTADQSLTNQLVKETYLVSYFKSNCLKVGDQARDSLQLLLMLVLLNLFSKLWWIRSLGMVLYFDSRKSVHLIKPIRSSTQQDLFLATSQPLSECSIQISRIFRDHKRAWE